MDHILMDHKLTVHIDGIRRRPARRLAALAVALSVALLPLLNDHAQAQQRSKASKSQSSSSSGRSQDLAERVQQLEAQIVDMRVAVDTLSSLPPSGRVAGPMPAGRGGFGGGSGGDARIDVLETQVRALTAQVEQLAAEVRKSAAANPGGGLAIRPAPTANQSAPGWRTRPPQGGDSWSTQGRAPEVRGYNSGAAAGGGDGDANRSYLQAINLYNQEDYKGARDAIGAFLKAYPNHPQSPTAQYRLAQSNFKLRQYSLAAGQFWTLVKRYPNEPVAPDSFAMFAAALGKAGRSKDACEGFQQMRARYPNDAPHMPPEAKAERARLGC